MYTGHGFNKWGIGDVDILKKGDTYHLFHLVLPNHAYIAHAVSRDGLRWTRVKHALFISDPGDWDDSMLWTMHVSEDPDRPGAWRMFYTGLTHGERGRVQRVGMAESDDLFEWRKIDAGFYPLEIDGKFYESRIDEGRSWVSFRDPFFYSQGGKRWLLAAARVKEGPLVHRGCVSLAEETSRNRFEFREPLYFPARYDDIEVPTLVEISGCCYLIGSIREDIKVHYWWSDDPAGPYRNFSDNVLMPKGNYAARICQDNGRVLIWNFFSPANAQKGMSNMFPPPKELVVGEERSLRMRSFYGFDRLVESHLDQWALSPIATLMGNPSASIATRDGVISCGTKSGLELFCLKGGYRDFRLRGLLTLVNDGKCGWVFHLDDQGSGYYISLDPFKGLAQIRAWGENPVGGIEDAYIYESLQAAYFVPKTEWPISFELVVFGKYIELSLGGYVILSLVDARYREGRVGFYTESGQVQLESTTIEEIRSPSDEACDPATQAEMPPATERSVP